MRRLTNILMTAGTLALLFACGNPKPVQPEKPANPGAPTGVYLHASTETSLTFQWDAMEHATGYQWALYQGSEKVKEGSVSSRNVKVDGLQKATDYRFGVCSLGATDDSGKRYVSAESSVEVRTQGTIDPPPGPGPEPTQTYEDLLIPAAEEDGIARAFPGAEGGGMYTTGGRGGKVFHVTNLNDSGEGSLRWALGQSGARTIVFDVAGEIALKSVLEVNKGDVTIAGQTAPGDGICLKDYTTNVKASNVIIRFVRFRLGNAIKDAEGYSTQEDAIWGRRNDNVILDHCSMSWSVDECASFYENENFTLQWCILGESLRNAGHKKGSHGYGGIWGGKNASFHHNLLAHHDNRTPRFDHPQVYADPSNPTRRGHIDHRNNVIYNWGSGSGCYGGNDSFINMVGNYYKPGPASSDRKFFIEADGPYKESGGTYARYEYPYLYLSGNKHVKYEDISADNASGVYWKVESGYSGAPVSTEGHIILSPHTITGREGVAAYVTTHTADEACARVLATAGACLRRDAVDQRITGNVSAGSALVKNGLIDSPADVGGWPEYKATDAEKAALKDTDGDGMSDAFEDAFGLDKTSAADGTTKTLDKHGRYTNLEMYLHYLVKDIVAGQNAGGTYTKL